MASAAAAAAASSSSPTSFIIKHSHQSQRPQQRQHIPIKINRRSLSSTLSLFPFLLFPVSPSRSPSSAAAAVVSLPKEPTQLELEPYTDTNDGFTLLVPPSWTKVEKAGATALFEQGSNSIGVVVTPVRLSSLTDFGTPQFVADKLIQAERRKESTKQAEVVAVSERLGHGGMPVYEFEYTVDSTRGGLKRIFSAAFVASKKLFLLNIAHSDKPDNPVDNQTRMVLEQVLHSFDTTL